MVIVIVLTGILAAITGIFIVEPMRAYVDQARRAGLVDAADGALRRMSRDIRAAVPNSVRVSPDGRVLELLNAVSGARYRAAAPPADADAILEFNLPDASFDTLGAFPGLTLPFGSTSHFLVIYNLGLPGADVYEGNNVITPAGTSIAISSANRVSLGAAFRFAWESPRQRVFLSDGVIRYTCAPDPSNPALGTLRRRVSGDFVGPSVPSAPAAGELVTEHVAACAFDYAAGTATRSALVTLRLTLERGGEQVRLLRQVQVENLP